MTQPAAEYIVVKNNLVERLRVAQGGVEYQGPRSLRELFRGAREYLLLDALGGWHEPPDAMMQACAGIVTRTDTDNAPLRSERSALRLAVREDSDRAARTPAQRLRGLRERRERELQVFTRGGDLSCWRPGAREHGQDGVLPRAWLWTYRLRTQWASVDGTTALVVRKRGDQALVLQPDGTLHLGKIVPHHRRVELIERESRRVSWDSLTAV